MNKIFGALKKVAGAPKKVVEVALRRKAISAIIAAIAGILIVYGIELPSDIQDSLTTVIDFVVSLLAQ